MSPVFCNYLFLATSDRSFQAYFAVAGDPEVIGVPVDGACAC